MNILVTGGAGFIGRHLVKTLLGEGHTVRVLDSLSEQVHGSSARFPAALAGADVIHGDIRDTERLAAALAGVEVVVHLAAETGVGQSMYEVERYVDANDRGTASLLQTLIERQRPVRVVLASSRAVYGEGLYTCRRCGEVSPSSRDPEALNRAVWDPVCPICAGAIAPAATHEDAAARPGSVYAATKLAQEHLCAIVGGAYGFPTTILRYFNVYGPGQSLSNPYTGILSTFYTRARNGKPIEVYEDGRESRDFVFVADVVAATRRALHHPDDQPRCRVLNIGAGAPVSIGDLAGAMILLGGWDVPIDVTGAYRAGDVRHVFADTKRAAHLLGFVAATPLVDGLRQWLAWAARADSQDATDAALAHLTARGLYRTAKGG
ncbi:MAG: SDR family NAD(P)-dependent oxidoreductase [Chloroflexia bacterium]|nr:SDR family NAD(P)-dependent oxidoreductase [Chloroflexia bacterium]